MRISLHFQLVGSKYVPRFSTSYMPLLVTLGMVLLYAFSCNTQGVPNTNTDEPDSGPDAQTSELVEGQCGLTGQMVRCNRDLDCSNTGRGFCLPSGECSGPDQWPVCESMAECEVGEYCDESYKCTIACNTHEDCGPGGRCDCANWPVTWRAWDAVGYCRYIQCMEWSSCPYDHTTVPGMNLCQPVALDGDCRRHLGFDCPEGYDPVGLDGCQEQQGQ